MVFFKSSRKISSYLVRSKLYSAERSVWSFNCEGSRCQIRAYVNETDSFTRTVTETYKINHRFDCMEKCLIYLLTCNKCRKQYLGQIVETFAIGGIITDLTPVNMRMANHAYRNTCTNINSEHRSFLNDVSITLIDKTNPTNPLKKNYCEPTLKTFVPYGLNMKENV